MGQKKQREKNNKYQREYQRIYRKIYSQKVKEYQRKWHKENPEKVKEYRKKNKDIYFFGRPKKELLKIWNYQCAICGSKKRLEVHHIDGKGSNVLIKEKNNALENLVVLCSKCHYWIHIPNRSNGRKLKTRGLWSDNGIPKCLICGTTERRHWGRGLCLRCYERTRKEYKIKWYLNKNYSEGK